MNKGQHLDAKGKGKIIYDYKYDTLVFRVEERIYMQSVEFLNFVADIDNKGFVTGIRVFDASKVFGVNKYVLKNIVNAEFKAQVENNTITIILRFAARVRNNLIPLFSSKENFTQQITTTTPNPMTDSIVECAATA
jgi:uncharacterized protein YuzE